MILFLSSSFLSRIRIQWKPDLKGFLVGNRNLFFFYPEMILESAEISPAAVESYLASHGQEAWQLLGFLSPEELPLFPGYAELNTSGVSDPSQWTAKVHLPGDQGPDRRNLEIRISGES
ncbi:hypothetical protein L0222_29690 [bacterium]|nr:hypothetical protein [bacterium]MCI0603525.1 hypothetical protein [bacterium]